MRNPSSATPLPPLLKPARRLLRHVDRHPGLYLPRAAGIALAALIAYQGAALLSVIVTPIDDGAERAARPPGPRSTSLLGSFDPFFTGASAAAAPAAAIDLTHHGHRQDGPAGSGSAIISQSDGAQRSVGVGEEIAPGLVLKRVGHDHAIIIRNGMDERLAFKAFGSTGSAAAPAAGPAQPPFTPTAGVSPAIEARPRPPTPRVRGLPARSVDFADPSTIPTSLTTPNR